MLVLALVLIALALIAYAPVLANGGFVWDDDVYITSNRWMHDLDGLRQIWIPGKTVQYYPLVFTTFWIEFQLWADDPTGYHAVNVIVHALNAWLVWRLAVVLRLRGAWVIAAIFALHPVHVESVAWITERKNVLSAFFYFGAALALLRFEGLTSSRGKREDDARADLGWYGLSLVLFALALLSKTVAASLPVALALLMAHRRIGLSMARLARLVPMLILGLAAGLFTAHLEAEQVGATGPDFEFSPLQRLFIACRALLFYPWKLLWPHPLMFTYPRWDIAGELWLNLGALAAVMVIALAVILAFRRGHRGLALALAFYAVTIFPALGFVNVYPMLFSFVADHFQYVASLGIIALVVGGASRLVPRREAQVAMLALLLPVLMGLTWRQALIYRDEKTLWRDTAAKNPTAWMARNNLASLALGQAEQARQMGDQSTMRALAAEALDWAQQALAIREDRHNVHSNAAETLFLLGRHEEALAHARRAVELAPHVARHRFELARLHHTLGQHDQAIDGYRAAIELNASSVMARLELAKLLALLGRLEEATTEFRELLVRDPANATALAFLGDDAARRGDFVQAAALLRQSVLAARDAAARWQATYKLALLLASCPDDRARDGIQAIALAEQLLQLGGSDNPYSLDVLSMALAEVGRWEDAARAAGRAIDAATAHGKPELARQIEFRLQHYGAHRPWRQ